MDILKTQLDRIKQQLAGLTVTQRMLVATLVALMGITIFYWGHYASSAEMVPIMDQALSVEDVGNIDAILDKNGVPHEETGGRVVVPADRRMQALADLTYARALPRNGQGAFDDMFKNVSPFSSPGEREAYEIREREFKMGQLFERLPGVTEARVGINAKNERRIEGTIPPTATVFLQVGNSSENKKELATSAAAAMTGAVSALTTGHVTVLINGITIRVPDADSNSLANGDDYISFKKQSELDNEEKIRQAYLIPGLTVSVLCDVENSVKTEMKRAYDPSTTLSKERESTEKTDETSSPAASAAEPGAGANTSASIPTGAAVSSAATSTSTETTTKTDNFAGVDEQNISTPAGKPTARSATVGVPRGYLVDIYRRQTRTTTDPDETVLQTFATAELTRIRNGVKAILGLKADDAVWVDMYTEPVEMLPATSTPAAPAATLATVTGHAKEIGVGVLAVFSLFMMSSMVRKATPAPLVIPKPVEEEPQILVAGEALAGEAGFSDTTLDGMELDEDSVRTNQMLDQVSTMVKENPEGAATLVKRWLNRT